MMLIYVMSCGDISRLSPVSIRGFHLGGREFRVEVWPVLSMYSVENVGLVPRIVFVVLLSLVFSAVLGFVRSQVVLMVFFFRLGCICLSAVVCGWDRVCLLRGLVCVCGCGSFVGSSDSFRHLFV